MLRRKNNLFFLLSLLASLNLHAQSDTSLTFSEIMFYGISGNNEFIEIFNLSYTQTFDLTGYKIKYATSNSDSLAATTRGSLLRPRSYLVIFEGDYDTLTGIYRSVLPDSVLVMSISDNSFGTSGMANTSDRILHLLNPVDDTLEIYLYSANNSQGRSDEKINISYNNSEDNWGNAVVHLGTPGLRNSITPYSYDLAASHFSYTPPVIIAGGSAELRFSATNKGSETVPSFILELYQDFNLDSIPQSGELIYSLPYNTLIPGDSVQLYHTVVLPSASTYGFIALVNYQEDEFLSNNSINLYIRTVAPEYSFNEIIFNEIMYAPGSPEKEWVEMYNNSNRLVNLKKWRIADRSSEVALTAEDFLIQPNSFVVFSDDSSVANLYPYPFNLLKTNIPSLNNDGDLLVIKDSLGVIIDSLSYTPQWGGAGGRSLERIYYDSASHNPLNWSTSSGIYNGTPGIKNTAIPKSHDLAFISFSSKVEYGIANEPFPLTTKIFNKGTLLSGSYTINIYNDLNLDSVSSLDELVLTLYGSPLSPQDSVLFNFSLSYNNPGNLQFIAKLNYPLDEDSVNNTLFSTIRIVQNYTQRNDVLINEIMYAPLNGEPEWVELYNNSVSAITLNMMKLADAADTATIKTSFIITPGTYFVIAKDSTIANFYSFPVLFASASLPTFNNSGDRVMLLDSLGKVVDSLYFTPFWGGGDGESLERKTFSSASTDSLNWAAAKLQHRATPGRINSRTQKNYDLALDTLFTTPVYPVKGDTISVSVQILNTGKSLLAGSLVFWEDTNNDSIPDILLSSFSFPPVTPGELSTVTVPAVISNLLNRHNLYLFLNAPQDEDTTDNYEHYSIYPGVKPGVIAINEIMYDPSNGEPEWIELFNTSEDTVSLHLWKIRDMFTTPATTVVSEDISMTPGTYLILTKDSTITDHHRIIPSPFVKLSLPVLNNDRDGLIILDERGRVIDSMTYNGTSSGRSLERISNTTVAGDSSFWQFSKDIEWSTPGRINSVIPRQYDAAIGAVYAVNSHPISGDTLTVAVTLKNLGSLIVQPFILELHSFNGMQNIVKEELVSFPADADSTTIIFPAHSIILDSALTLTAIIRLSDEDLYNNEYQTVIYPGVREKSIVINEIMFDPYPGQPEWIEIYNRLDTALNLNGWSVSDYLPSPIRRTIPHDFIIQPGQFGIISADSAMLVYPAVSESDFIYLPLPSLGNSSDGVFIFDNHGSVIDSIIYSGNWDLLHDHSLERRNTEDFSGNKLNWIASGIPGGSPGQMNAAVNNYPPQNSKVVINEIMFAPSAGKAEYVELYNPGEEPVNLFYFTIGRTLQERKRISDGSVSVEPGSYFVIASDRSIFSEYSYLLWPGRAAVLPGFSLRNETDTIIIAFQIEGITDSLIYSKNWHNKNFGTGNGRSLEKINPLLSGNNPRHWSTSVAPADGTPGEENSIFTASAISGREIAFTPNPFSPDEDGFEDFTIISYETPFTAARFNATIYDRSGRLVRKLLEGETLQGKGEIVYDGKDNSGRALNIGIYILFLEATDLDSGGSKTIKAAFVVARKL